MRNDELDRILSSDDAVAPSRGFTDAVMGAVRRQAAEPPPLPFPWARLAAGLAACAVSAASGTVVVMRMETTLAAMAAPFAGAVTLRGQPVVPLVAMALLLAIGTVRLRRLLGQG